MNNLQSQGDIHVAMEDLNTEAAAIKKNLEELEI